jgi:hypothetical protein
LGKEPVAVGGGEELVGEPSGEKSSAWVEKTGRLMGQDRKS